MTLNLTRMLSLVLAFGFFISCSGTNVLVGDSIEKMDTDELRSTSQELLDQNPDSPTGNHMAGLLAYREALSLPAANRSDSYSEMAIRFETTLEQTRDRSVIDHVRRTQTRAWQSEFTSAQQLSTNPDTYTLAGDHARNAVIVKPDSLQPFILLSELSVRLGNLSDAAEYLSPVVQRGEEARYGEHYEKYAFLLTRNGDYSNASLWYERSINWIINHRQGTLLPTGNDISRGSLLNAYHGAINTLSEAGYTEKAIAYLELLSSTLADNTIYHDMLIVQYFNLIRSTALDEYGAINPEILDNGIRNIQRSVDASPDAMLFTANEFIDLAAGHIDLQNELTSGFDLTTDPTISLLLEEARQLFQRILESDSLNEEAVYGMASTFSLTGNETEAAKWLELLD